VRSISVFVNTNVLILPCPGVVIYTNHVSRISPNTLGVRHMGSQPDEGQLDETRPFRVLSPGTVISHYKIMEKIGAGGMGVVYRAEDTRLKRLVALKFLPPGLTRDSEAKERFTREAQAASALDHNNICTIYEIDETDDGQMFIAMACYDGETLREKIKRNPLRVEEALDIAIQVAQGLVKAHEKGITHRDIKPANIMVTDESTVKIMDFGLAKLAGQSRLTEAGTTVGTVAYMSPEQVRGREIDHKADIWSLGVVLYEVLAGELPFRGEGDQATIYSILNEEPQPVASIKRDIPGELEDLVSRALTKDPGSRYENMGDFLVDLRKAREDLEVDVSKRLSESKAKPSVAVLPFIDMSPQKDQEYFCDGMAEELINALTNLEGLQVASRTSAFQFKDKGHDIREVGRRLKVQNVLEGSVRKAGDKLRITAQLVSVADGYHLWSEKYDREMEDIFVIQDEISLAIVEKLKLKLLRREKARLVKRFTEDEEAYNLYLKGRYFWNRRHEGGLQRGLECFQEAIAKDPNYALAYVGVADCYNLLGLFSWVRPKEAYPNARAAAQRALEIDSTIGEAHTSLGWISTWFDWDWPAAEIEFKQALALSPNYATAHEWYSLYLANSGRLNELEAVISRALELDPLSLIINATKGLCYYYMRRYDDAIAQCLRTLEMDPNYAMAHLYLEWVYSAHGMWEQAIASGEKLVAISGESPVALGFLGSTYAMSGQHEKAAGILGRLDDLSRQGYVSPYYRAIIHMGLNDKGKAFECFEEAYLERSSFLASFKTAPIYGEYLGSDPRYHDLLKRIGLE
jgi:serine/threonine protein kinase